MGMKMSAKNRSHKVTIGVTKGAVGCFCAAVQDYTD